MREIASDREIQIKRYVWKTRKSNCASERKREKRIVWLREKEGKRVIERERVLRKNRAIEREKEKENRVIERERKRMIGTEREEMSEWDREIGNVSE